MIETKTFKVLEYIKLSDTLRDMFLDQYDYQFGNDRLLRIHLEFYSMEELETSYKQELIDENSSFKNEKDTDFESYLEWYGLRTTYEILKAFPNTFSKDDELLLDICW